METKIIQCGWDAIIPQSSDYYHAMKWFGDEKIQRLVERHQEYLAEQQKQPQQISLFELI